MEHQNALQIEIVIRIQKPNILRHSLLINY